MQAVRLQNVIEKAGGSTSHETCIRAIDEVLEIHHAGAAKSKNPMQLQAPKGEADRMAKIVDKAPKAIQRMPKKEPRK